MRGRGASGLVVVYQPGNRRRTILTLIVLTAVTLITLDVRGSGPISALRGGAHDVVNPIAVAAQVVEGAPSNFEFTVQIGKGESDGVGVDMTVVTGAGLVGRVFEVSRDRATVLLVKDPQSGVGVRIEKSGTPGVVKGRGDSDTLRVDFVEPNVDVTKGEVVYTSGQQNSSFPAAIPIGTVSKVTKAHGDL